MISLEKWIMLTPLQKLPKNERRFGQINCCQRLWKFAWSAINCPIWSHWTEKVKKKMVCHRSVDLSAPSLHHLSMLKSSALNQCDQIWRFIALWTTFKCFFQHLICPNLSHSYWIFIKESKSIIFLVKSFLGKFYRHLAIFFWSHSSQSIL